MSNKKSTTDNKKSYYFSVLLDAQTIEHLANKLASCSVGGPVSEEEWGYVEIKHIFRDRDDHKRYLLFWEVHVTNNTLFNVYKLKSPKQYHSLAKMMSDDRYPRHPELISEVDFIKDSDWVKQCVFDVLENRKQNG